ncbi:hypothetical protein EG328_003311 [Venturia inaequalis]|uniref:Uncharacterized protein n=1 Tax=Venturia inaequalis TaxID=5025 RepID=A0A8H3VJ92_VENIN|nr:hypothetical protein EG328_003311 [Venturia inaequalis]
MPFFSKPIDTFFFLLTSLGLTGAAPVPAPADADATIKYTPDPATIPAGVHYWPISEREKAHLSEQLGVDFSKLNIYGTFVQTPKEECQGCGKESGLEDFVDGALKSGVHRRDFMIKSLTHAEGRGESPPHEISCSNCGTKYKRMMQWAQSFSWTYPDVNFKEDGSAVVEMKAVEEYSSASAPATAPAAVADAAPASAPAIAAE